VDQGIEALRVALENDQRSEHPLQTIVVSGCGK
jgi:hypothetical protein